MKLKFEDLARSRYVPHTVKGKEGPLGNMVMMSESEEDIGAALMTGDYQSSDPFVSILADVIAGSIVSDPAKISGVLQES